MKCFYCSWLDESKEAGICVGCGKELGRFCPVCKIKYDKNAKFCMSCGGKLEELSGGKAKEQTAETARNQGHGGIEIEFDDDLPRGFSEKGAESSENEKSESFLEIDLGIEAAPDNENPGEKTLKVQTAPDKKTPSYDRNKNK